MFVYPATEVFSTDGQRRVVWSREEFDQALTDGWSEEQPVEPAPELIQEPRKKAK